MTLIDSHCHLDFADFDPDREAVLARARAVGVAQMVVPAVTRQRFSAVADLQQLYGVWAAYGLHPMFGDAHQPDDLNALTAWLDTQPAVAIGEVGLDGRRDDLSRQQHYFCAQIELAQQHHLPLIIHAHAALEQVLQTLARYAGVRFVIHAFSGSDQQLARVFALGGWIGVGGTLTYPRAQRLRRQVATAPLARILLETDAPDQPLCGKQERRNEPAHLADICATLARLRNMAVDDVAHATCINTQQFFNRHERESSCQRHRREQKLS